MCRTHQQLDGRILAGLMLLFGLFLVPGVTGAQSEPPNEGQVAVETLALLDYNRKLCDGIAGKVVAYWRRLGSTPAAELKAVQQFVGSRELSNLAQGREVSDIIDSLLPRVRKETDSTISAALQRLQTMEVKLCDTVAYPNTSRQEFEDEIGRILDRIEREEAELGRRLVVPEETLKRVLAPYLGQIQLAGVEAEGEYRDYLESLKPPPREPTPQELMQAWHDRYARAVLPTKQALGKYLKGKQTNDGELIRTACREISAAVIPLLRRENVFNAPVSKINKPLYQAFVEIKLMATNCVAGRSREMEQHYREMQSNLATASGVLSEFSLRP